MKRSGMLLVAALAAAMTMAGPAAGAEPAWEAPLATFDEHLRAGALSRAVIAWHDAHGAALQDRGWKGMIAVGDAALRLGAATRTLRVSEGTARDAYVAALYRARRQGSIEGVLRVLEAAARLHDRGLAHQGLAVADLMIVKVSETDGGSARAEVERLRAGWPGANAYSISTPPSTFKLSP